MSRLPHVAALDGVRGVAVALVVVHHVVVRDPDAAMRGGWLGVDVFFVLSGFLITVSVIGRPELGDFLRRRFWRLAPAATVLLGVYATVSLGAGDTKQRLEWAFAGATQWANIQGAIGPPFSPHLGHLWSLSAEVQFYVAWGVALVLLVQRNVSRVAIGGVLVALFVASHVLRVVLWDGGTPWNRLYLGPDTHSASLLAGCLVGLAFASDRAWARGALAVLTVPAAAMIGWAVVELSFLDGRTYRFALTAVAVSAAVVVAAAASRAPSPLRPLLELAPVVWLGRISYSLYLWHLPIIEEVDRRRPEGDLRGIALIAIPASLAVGWVSYALVERPLLSARNRARLRARFGRVREPAIHQ